MSCSQRIATRVPSKIERFCNGLRPAALATCTAGLAWCRATCAELRLGRGLDSGVVLEELLVQLDEALPLIGRLVFREDRLHRAHRLAGAAVDALVRVDVEHRLAFIDAVHRTDLDTGLVLHVDAWLGDDVRHQDLPLSITVRGARCRVR